MATYLWSIHLYHPDVETLERKKILHVLRAACADYIITNEIIIYSLQANGLLTFINLCILWNVKSL